MTIECSDEIITMLEEKVIKYNNKTSVKVSFIHYAPYVTDITFVRDNLLTDYPKLNKKFVTFINAFQT